jgi:hypothetical protein
LDFLHILSGHSPASVTLTDRTVDYYLKAALVFLHEPTAPQPRTERVSKSISVTAGFLK